MQLSYQFSIAFLKSKPNFEHFEKKRKASQLKSFRNHRQQKKCFLKCLKDHDLRHPYTINVFADPKHW